MTVLDPGSAALVERLLDVAVRGLARMYRPNTDEFAFTRTVNSAGDDALGLRGTSMRYAAIVALGAHFLPEAQQRQVLGGRTEDDFIEILVRRLAGTTNLGDAALVCWAAAQAGHPLLPKALDRLYTLDGEPGERYVVEVSWLVSALAAARSQADVEGPLDRARRRLMDSRHGASPLFPHATGPGLLPWYRTHVACFADQVYPIQALARLHASGDDVEARMAAEACAARICELQGSGGQWWWHYDARGGNLIEGYPVYSVHQHAMAPMALLDLTEAGGGDYAESIRIGLRWMTDAPELPGREPLILDEAGMTWRKVYRGDPRKLVRAVHGLTTRAVPGLRVRPVERLFRPGSIDRECRPYEFGWLLFTWLGALGTAGPATAHAGGDR
jgi:hypothetical protein